MSKKKLLSRILAFVLVFSFIVSGIPFDNFNTATEVFAVDGGGAGEIGGGSTKPGVGGDHPEHRGSGWRISLIPSDIYLDEANHDQIQQALEEYKKYAILITNKSEIRMPRLVEDGSTGLTESIIAPSLEAVFPGAPSGYNPQPMGARLESNYDFTEAYWNTEFRDFILGYENKNELVDHVLNYLNSNGGNVNDPRDSGVSEMGISVTVEPVVFFESCGYVIEYSFQDLLGGDSGKNRPFFNRLLGEGCSNGITKYPKPASMWGNFPSKMDLGSGTVLKLGNLSKLYSIFKDYDTGDILYDAVVSRGDCLDNGVLYFNLGKLPPSDDSSTSGSSSKAETNVVVAYTGKPGASDGHLEISKSHNFVTSDNVSAIKAYTTDTEITTINEEVYKLILSSYGSTFMNPFGTSKVSSLDDLVERLSNSSSSFFDSYIVTYGGSYKVNTARADNASIKTNLIDPLNTYINNLANESVSWTNSSIEGADFNIGSKKALSLGANKKPNDIVEEVVNILL